MKVLNKVFNYLVGGLFVFSGLIKVNDPVGTAIKFEEYFEVFSSDIAGFFHVFVPFALPMAVFFCVFEVVLGVALLVSFRRRDTLYALTGLIVFFTFLTFYSAYFNKVTDCGCFGDAIKLTPWTSFGKDIVLLLMIIGMFVTGKEENVNKQSMVSIVGVGTTTLISFIVAIAAINNLPFIDFRAYKVGANIVEDMKPRAEPDIEYIFEKDGKEVRSKEYLSADEGYVYKNYDVKNKEETEAKIKDFNIADPEGNDMTSFALEGKKVLFIVHKMAKTAKDAYPDIIDGLVGAEKAGAETMIVTSDGNNFEEFRHEMQIPFPYYVADATVLKTMIRSNPGLIALKDGVVVGKWHYNNAPEGDELMDVLE